MIAPEIISYIKTEKEKNTPDPIIKTNLLANGWSEADITEAMKSLSISAGTPVSAVSGEEMKSYRSKIKWSTFLSLIILDFIAIMLLGGYGIFGVSPTSIVIRIIVIYVVSSLAAKGSKPGDNKGKAVMKGILKVVGALILVYIILFGLLFLYCAFGPNIGF